MRRPTFLWAALLVAAAPLSADEKKPAKPRVTTFPVSPMAGNVTQLSISPSTASFNSTNPDGTVSASTTTVTWRVSGGNNSQTWTLSIAGPAGGFTNCPTVPLTAVQVNAPSGSVSGGSGTFASDGTKTLTSVAQTIAHGLEGTGTKDYSVTVNYTIIDSWQYKATTALNCTATMTYTANAP